MFPFARLHCPDYFLLYLHLDQRVDQEVNHGWTVHHSLLGHYHCHGVGHYHCHFHCRGFGHCHGVGHCLARATTTVWGLGHCQPRPSPRPLPQPLTRPLTRPLPRPLTRPLTRPFPRPLTWMSHTSRCLEPPISGMRLQDTHEYNAYLFILIPISAGLVVAYDFNHIGIQNQHCCPIILSVASTLDTNPVRSISSIQQPDNPPSRYTTLLNGSTEGME